MKAKFKFILVGFAALYVFSCAAGNPIKHVPDVRIPVEKEMHPRVFFDILLQYNPVIHTRYGSTNGRKYLQFIEPRDGIMLRSFFEPGSKVKVSFNSSTGRYDVWLVWWNKKAFSFWMDNR